MVRQYGNHGGLSGRYLQLGRFNVDDFFIFSLCVVKLFLVVSLRVVYAQV